MQASENTQPEIRRKFVQNHEKENGPAVQGSNRRVIRGTGGGASGVSLLERRKARGIDYTRHNTSTNISPDSGSDSGSDLGSDSGSGTHHWQLSNMQRYDAELRSGFQARVVKRDDLGGIWSVEATNEKGIDEPYVTLFAGPDAKDRAIEYAAFKYQFCCLPSQK